MEEGLSGTRSGGELRGKSPQLSAVSPSVAVAAPVTGSSNGAGPVRQRRRLGSRAAYNRWRQLLNGRALQPHQRALLLLTARLICHAENISSRLYTDGELTAEGAPRQILGRLLELQKEIRTNLQAVFGHDVTGDTTDLAALMGASRSRGE